MYKKASRICYNKFDEHYHSLDMSSEYDIMTLEYISAIQSVFKISATILPVSRNDRKCKSPNFRIL
jgi:hypothetical protein